MKSSFIKVRTNQLLILVVAVIAIYIISVTTQKSVPMECFLEKQEQSYETDWQTGHEKNANREEVLFPAAGNPRAVGVTSVPRTRWGFRAGNPYRVPATDLDDLSWQASQNSSRIAELNAGEPIVIQWRTTQFWHDPFDNHKGKAAFAPCLINNCMILPMDVDHPTVDAYLFQVAINEKDRMPEHRKPWQKYIFLSQESEVRTIVPSHMKDIFNLTVSHRLDADVPVPHGIILRKSSPDPIPKPVANVAANKTGLVAWVVSNCNTPSKREIYATKLQKFINIDIYGKCGTKACPEPGCWEHINKKYKFYLAFENSICVDYITEKLYRTLEDGKMIPIVLGGADYADRLPKKSYINVADFESPEELAEYLKLLDANDVLYNEYFQWQHHYTAHQEGGYRCYLCAYLHLNKSVKKVLPDMQQWFSPKYRCMEPKSYYGPYVDIPWNIVCVIRRDHFVYGPSQWETAWPIHKTIPDKIYSLFFSVVLLLLCHWFWTHCPAQHVMNT